MVQSRFQTFLFSNGAPRKGSIDEAMVKGLPSRRIIVSRFMSSTTTENLVMEAKESR